MVFYTWVLQFFKKWTKERIRWWYISEEKSRRKTNSATIMISVDGKEAGSPVKLKFYGESFE